MTKRKFTAAQARRALVVAGHELLFEAGLSGGICRVSLADAINRSGVPRPSAYRVFDQPDGEPQRKFHDQLLLEVIGDGPTVDVEELRRQFAALTSPIETTATDQDLTRYLADLLRLAAAGITDGRFADTRTGAYLSALAASMTDGLSAEIRDALRRAELALIDAVAVFVREALDAFGLQMRGGLSHRDLGATIVAAITGAVLTQQVSPPDVMQLAPHPRGETTAWTPLGMSLLGIVAMATGPDPRKVASARPNEWTLP